MKITDIRGAMIDSTPMVRVLTDEGVDGFGPVETSKTHVLPTLPFYRAELIGLDPQDVERCVARIRRFGAHKPWGSVVSAIEIALWDLAGKAAGLPVHRLLGGKVRDRVRVYNGGVRTELTTSFTPEDYAEQMRQMVAAEEGFTAVKAGVAFHGFMSQQVDGFFYGESRDGPRHPNRGVLTRAGREHVVNCVAAMREALPAQVDLALDAGPGFLVADAIALCRDLEPYGLLWVEDLLTGDYVPWISADQYREVTSRTSTPVHTGEQIYLRHNYLELLSSQAVRVIGPDPCDVGGLAELKWVGELADAYGVAIAPHGVLDGVLGLAALVQVSATLPQNFIAFEYPVAPDPWWYDAVDGLPTPIVHDGFVDVSAAPGLGLEFDIELMKSHLAPGSEGFFDWD